MSSCYRSTGRQWMILIKHLKSLADEDTIEEIRGYPYLQYFLGYDAYRYDPPFTPSLFVTIRRRPGRCSVWGVNEGS